MGRKTWNHCLYDLYQAKKWIINKSLEISDNLIKVYSNLEDLFENETGNICFIGGAKIFDLLYKNYPHYIDLIRLTKFDSAMSPETTNDMENLIYLKNSSKRLKS